MANSSHGTGSLRVMLLSMEWTPEVSGGVGTYVYELARGLVAEGCDVRVLACATGEASDIRQRGLTVHRLAPSRSSLARSARVSMVDGILAFNEDLVRAGEAMTEGWRPDIVHFHQWHTQHAARALANRLAVPLLGTSHHISEPAERWWGQTPEPDIVERECVLFDGSTELVVVSHSMKQLICARHPVAPDRVRVIHCGLDSDPFRNLRQSPAAIARLRAKVAALDEIVILYTGRIHPQKGIAAIYEAAERVVAKSPRRVRYLLAGGTDSRASTRMIEQLKADHTALAPNIQLLGKLPRMQLPLLHRIADFAVVPSVYEPFGFTALETMASGTPVIVSDDGGLAEIVEHGESGLKVPMQSLPAGQRSIDVEAFADAQLRLIADEALRRRLGSQGQQHACRAFSIQAMVRANLDVYADLMAKHAAFTPASTRAESSSRPLVV